MFMNFLTYILENTSISSLERMSGDQSKFFDTSFFQKLMKMFEDDPKLINSFLDFIFAEPFDFPWNFTSKSINKPILATEAEPRLNRERIIEIYAKNPNSFNAQTSIKEKVNAKCLFSNSFLDYNNEVTIEVFKGISQFEPTNAIFSNITLINILDYKWENYARRIYFTEAFNFLLFLAIYLLNANYFLTLRFEDNDEDLGNIRIYSIVCDSIILCLVMKYMFSEVQQLISLRLADYFSSLWNIVDVTLISFCFISTIFDILSCVQVWEDRAILKSMHAFTIFFGYLRILSYARGIEGSSFMIKLIIQVIFDIKYFLLLMFIFIVALTSSG